MINCCKEIVECSGAGNSKEKKPVSLVMLERLTGMGLMPRRRQHMSLSEDSTTEVQKKKQTKKAKAEKEKLESARTYERNKT